ncbi:MAG: rhodanese-like domain-containing protein [Saprospirales bacterium]|nr:rhodanese-like domain-containing protein [Saprospirales bacterium]MBK8489986.1 rhodanese-like domain-containing protein [Saprospirales bacterium]
MCTLIVGCAQNPPASLPEVKEQAFNKKLLSLLDFSVPLIGVKELNQEMKKAHWILLDAREWEEYEISHIIGARFAGYDHFKIDEWKDLQKDQSIAVYCSVGYRSEKIAKKLEKEGFTNVYNLYGSIFEWVNQGYPVVDSLGQPTNSVHTYNEAWSRWISNGKIVKIW